MDCVVLLALWVTIKTPLSRHRVYSVLRDITVQPPPTPLVYVRQAHGAQLVWQIVLTAHQVHVYIYVSPNHLRRPIYVPTLLSPVHKLLYINIYY